MNLKKSAANYLKTAEQPEEPTSKFWLEVGKQSFSAPNLARYADIIVKSSRAYASATEKQKWLNWMLNVNKAKLDYLTRVEENIPRYVFTGVNVHIGEYSTLSIVFSAHRGVTRHEVGFLTNSERGWVKTTEWILNEEDRRQFLLNKEAEHLAYSFERQTLEKASKITRPPLTGVYRMRPPAGMPGLSSFEGGEFRLVIKGDHIWFSHIDKDGDCTVAYWSPIGDTMNLSFPPILAWPVRVFLACLWYDAKDTKTQTIKRIAPRFKEKSSKRPSSEKYVILPRKIWNLEWASEKSKSLYQHKNATEQRRSPRCHYRRLQPGHRASEKAANNAWAWGHPEPPEGYTFVSPQGVPPTDIPKLVITGLDIAYVALSAL